MISIRGARQHNLKNIDLDLPTLSLIVFTGVSGSGKSSLAFDTIFAEGQRRYVESLSAYARQFLGQLDKPEVDAIEGLSPAIAIDQKSTSHNPRSTVGTVTEIYDYLRLLFGRAGEPHCPKCDRSITPQTIDQMCDHIMALPDGTKFQILAPVVRGKKGTHQQLLSSLRSQGFVRIRVNGEVKDLATEITLNKNKQHNLEIVIDRLIKKPDILERLADSLTTCLQQGEGIAIIQIIQENAHQDQEILFSENFACAEHGTVMTELSPRLFSFNSPYGACSNCHGLGYLPTFAPELIIPNPNKPVSEAIAPWLGAGSHRWSEKDNDYYLGILYDIGQAYNFDLNTTWKDLTPEQQQIILYGSPEIEMIADATPRRLPVVGPCAGSRRQGTPTKLGNAHQEDERGLNLARRYPGVVSILNKTYQETNSDLIKEKLARYIVNQTCPQCEGKRLKPEANGVRIGQYNIHDLTSVNIRQCQEVISNLDLTPRQRQIGELALKEIQTRLQFLIDVGLDYLTLDRYAMTLSGGEAQRIRLATQIGSGLTGVLYVLDEPSIGLHPSDNEKLLATLYKLRDLGNTLIVVEHDEDTIRSADYLVDIGPGAGIHGGEIVVQGSLEDLLQSQASLTGAYLSRRRVIEIPSQRREGNGKFLKLFNCHRNNLQHIDVEIPLGKFVCITGVSGSGKSTLINELLYPALQHHLGDYVPFPTGLERIEGLEAIDKVIVIDQSPIGRTPRSNPATYTGVLDVIRTLLTETVEAKIRGYKPGQFSFNLKGGRCEACSGQGVNVIEMNFLPDVYVQCEVCKGARYNRETLQVKYKGHSIADILNLTVYEALNLFSNIPRAVTRLQTLVDVGLGYIQLGQPAPTLSGGEAQRLKLASELSRRATGKTLYLIDEPTTGLSFYDTHQLLNVLQRLVDKGNSVIVIEHNLDLIRAADWLIDLGSKDNSRGGQILGVGTPETLSENPLSYTGNYL